MLVVAGLLHLGVSGGSVATRDPMKQGLIVFWAGLNYIVYYLAGMAWPEAAASIPAIVMAAWELDDREKPVSIVWRLSIA